MTDTRPRETSWGIIAALATLVGLVLSIYLAWGGTASTAVPASPSATAPPTAAVSQPPGDGADDDASSARPTSVGADSDDNSFRTDADSTDDSDETDRTAAPVPIQLRSVVANLPDGNAGVRKYQPSRGVKTIELRWTWTTQTSVGELSGADCDVETSIVDVATAAQVGEVHLSSACSLVGWMEERLPAGTYEVRVSVTYHGRTIRSEPGPSTIQVLPASS